MDLTKTIAVLNRMQEEGVVSRYAIGGAVGAFFYMEPGSTYDLDVFVAWDAGSGGIVTLTPIYDYLGKLGYEFQQDAIMIEGWPVQFMAPGSSLVGEAIERAVEFVVGGNPTRVFSQEHLMAICLETGRSKDAARLVQFLDEGTHDPGKFIDIIRRWHLNEKWTSFAGRFNVGQ